ncbi:hypothetical protein B0H14DRAFT_2652367 [Mycena olivaceomarginata]|nr:hypothetical protein B0H14DRAFT_2652367 [Mycena olivaceomarginata]
MALRIERNAFAGQPPRSRDHDTPVNASAGCLFEILGAWFDASQARRIAKARGTQRKTFDMHRLALRAKTSHSYLWNTSLSTGKHSGGAVDEYRVKAAGGFPPRLEPLRKDLEQECFDLRIARHRVAKILG